MLLVANLPIAGTPADFCQHLLQLKRENIIINSWKTNFINPYAAGG